MPNIPNICLTFITLGIS